MPDIGAMAGTRRTGAMLANGRIAAGRELLDIARETRVPLRHLKALEADVHDDLPALPYSIGFVKAYARAVGLDPETVASQFRAETSKLAHVPSSASLEPLDERRLPSGALVVGSVVVVVAIIAGLSAWGAGAFDAPPPVVATTPAVAAPDPQPLAETPAQDLSATPLAATPAVATPVVAAPVLAGAVELTAREDVWIKIYDRTTRTSIKSGTLAAGERFIVPATPAGLLLWTGKAGALVITVGGKPIPPLGGPVETVRDVSLAAADLAARAAAPAAGPVPIATIPTAAPRPIATMPGN